jgi:dihydrolipoamide dehydrogenase
MYDLIVLGGGPGGGAGAEKAARAGMNVLMVEKKHLGGVCLNEGCIPSKTLLYSAKVYGHAVHGDTFGVTASNVSFDLKKVIERKNRIVESLRKGSESSKKKLKVKVIFDKGEILGRQGDTIRVQTGTDVHEAKRLLIATGSEAIRPPFPGADRDFVMTNREILNLQQVPSKLVVIGGGVIGLEFANFFAEIGTAVTVVELLPVIAGPLDDEIRGILQKELEKKGIRFLLNSKVTSIGDHSVVYQAQGTSAPASLEADIVLMSVGRRPVIKDFGLEKLNVLVERGMVVTDERGRTNVPGVWAAGDINGKLMLAHTASREAEVCVADMLGKRDRIRYETIPSVIYTHPEVASVGLREDEAKAKGREVIISKLPFTYSGRFWAETVQGERSLCKVIIDKEYRTILGVHMVGPYSSEIIATAVPLIENEMRVEDVEELVFPHPTVGEIFKETVVAAGVESVVSLQQ